MVEVANRVFVNKQLTLVPTYQQLLRNTFQSDVTPIDIHKSEESGKEINAWVDAATKHKITDIVSPGNYLKEKEKKESN